jgi:hypothetical protein
MKRTIRPNSLGALAVSALALLGATNTTRAVEDFIINRFDTANEVSSFYRWWGNAPITMSWEGLVDADGNPNSGSLRVEVDFNLALYTNENQFCVLRTLNGVQWDLLGEQVDGRQYTNLVMDVKWDDDSPQRPYGDFGNLEYGLVRTNWDRIEWSYAVSTNISGWHHIVATIDPFADGLHRIGGIEFRMWSAEPTWGQTGKATFWVDNIKLIGRTSTEEPPPSLSLRKASPGLHLMSTSTGSNPQWNRQNVRTVGSDYSWTASLIDQVTYSITIAELGEKGHSGFQAHLFLAPGNALPYGPDDSALDWNGTNLVFLQIGGDANGAAMARFMHKINQGSGNSMFWNTDPGQGPVGTLADLYSPKAAGTWTLSHVDNVFTLTAPTGASTNFSMPSEAVALFGNPVYAYVGIQPNEVANVGQEGVISRVQMNGFGITVPIDDNFDGAGLNTALWKVVAADAKAVVTAPLGTAYRLSWTLPAAGFVLESANELLPGVWTSSPYTNSFQLGGYRMLFVPDNSGPPSHAQFYRMMQTTTP